MKIGKVPNNVLKELILNKIINKREEVLLRPKIGEDCCAIDLGPNVCVLSTDPITGAVNKIGRLAVHISCNDIASCGAEPIGLMVTMLAPPYATTDDMDAIMSQVCETAGALNVDIIGGHTEITDSVNRFIISGLAVGKVASGKLVTTSGAKAGDMIIMTKYAGIEGTAIIAYDKEKELVGIFGNEFVVRAQRFIDDISVVKEGIIAGEYGASAMHDVTEGGILGAIWEMAEASDKGVRIYREKIPVKMETLEICRYYGIDPLKLISSGSMLIACRDGEGLVDELMKNGIASSIIGVVTQNTRRILLYDGEFTEITQPYSDELYKVV